MATITDLYEMADIIVESQPKSKLRLQDIKPDQDEDASDNGKIASLSMIG